VCGYTVHVILTLCLIKYSRCNKYLFHM